VEREMKKMKAGTLKSGKSGKKVTSPKQAIAIGLSEARKEGKKVPKKSNQRNLIDNFRFTLPTLKHSAKQHYAFLF